MKKMKAIALLIIGCVSIVQAATSPSRPMYIMPAPEFSGISHDQDPVSAFSGIIYDPELTTNPKARLCLDLVANGILGPIYQEKYTFLVEQIHNKWNTALGNRSEPIYTMFTDLGRSIRAKSSVPTIIEELQNRIDEKYEEALAGSFKGYLTR